MINCDKSALKNSVAILGLMINIPYGLMLGWPSSTFPILISENSSVPITLDQSALVAGFLNFGHIFSLPIPKLLKHSEYGITLGVLFILFGWLVMYKAFDFTTLITSRLLVGLGYGYALAQFQHLINELFYSDKEKGKNILKITNVFVFIGFVAAFAFGPFVSFRQFSVISIVITVLTLISVLLQCILISQINLDKGSSKKHLFNNYVYVLTALRKKRTIKHLFFIFVISLFQQYCGMPASLVYTQIICKEFHAPFPEIWALIYALLFTAFYLFCTFSKTHNNLDTKLLLKVGSLMIVLCTFAEVLILYFDLDNSLRTYLAFTVFILFNFFHTFGINTITGKLITSFFDDDDSRLIAKTFQTFCLLLFALTGTKIFQILYGLFGLMYSFIFCTCISVLLFLSVLILYRSFY